MVDTVLRTAHYFVAVENSLTDDLIGGGVRDVVGALLSPGVLHVVTSVRCVVEIFKAARLLPYPHWRKANADRQEHKDPIWELWEARDPR